MKNMDICNFELSYMLDRNQYYEIKKDLMLKDKSKWQVGPNGILYSELEEKGILIHIHKEKIEDFFIYWLQYEIFVGRVLENNDDDCFDYDRLEYEVDKMIIHESIYLPELIECNFEKITLCCDKMFYYHERENFVNQFLTCKH